MSVVIIRIKVDLPAPFGPSSPKISPFPSPLNETSSTAVKSPYRFYNVIHFDGISFFFFGASVGQPSH